MGERSTYVDDVLLLVLTVVISYECLSAAISQCSVNKNSILGVNMNDETYCIDGIPAHWLICMFKEFYESLTECVLGACDVVNYYEIAQSAIASMH
jgi:hypothetical protein